MPLRSYNLFSDVTVTQKKKRKLERPPQKNTVFVTPVMEDTLVVSTGSDEIIDFAKDTVGGLDHFLKSLIATKKEGKVTRIAYFSDSMIEGDIITQDLRSNFQSSFGGRGVGFVPITSITAGFRQTIFHKFSSDWETHSLISSVTAETAPGISGFVHFPKIVKDSVGGSTPESWVSFAPAPYFKSLNTFQRLKLFYGPAGQNDAIHFFSSGKEVKKVLDGKELLNEMVLNDSTPLKNISLSFRCTSPVKIYGLSFESNSGVLVDNFAFRGNSGLPLTKIPSTVLRGFNKFLNYDLIILHYGLNVANAEMKDYSWYEAGMMRVVNYFKSCFPQSSFLLISVSDKGYKNEMEYETDPAIPLLVEAQKRIAEKTGVAFWNLYESMGGYNSMISWVDTTVPLANKDYAHLNFKGGKKVADMLYKHLMSEYEEYNEKRKIQ